MNSIKQTYLIKSPLAKVWRALTDPQIIRKWGAGPAEMSDKAGVKFSLWDGEIYGTNRKVVKEKKLVQDWYGGDWPKPSKVTFLFSRTKDSTKVELIHEAVPAGELKSIDQGWKDYYLGPLKEFLENNT